MSGGSLDYGSVLKSTITGCCFIRVSDCKFIILRSNLLIEQFSLIPYKIRCLNNVIADCHIGIQSAIKTERIAGIDINLIVGDDKLSARGKLNGCAIGLIILGVSGQVGDGVAGDGNSCSRIRLHIDTPHKAGNSIVLKLNSFHAIRRHRLCEESKVLASIALEFAVINRYIDSLHDLQTTLESAILKGYIFCTKVKGHIFREGNAVIDNILSASGECIIIRTEFVFQFGIVYAPNIDIVYRNARIDIATRQ